MSEVHARESDAVRPLTSLLGGLETAELVEIRSYRPTVRIEDSPKRTRTFFCSGSEFHSRAHRFGAGSARGEIAWFAMEYFRSLHATALDQMLAVPPQTSTLTTVVDVLSLPTAPIGQSGTPQRVSELDEFSESHEPANAASRISEGSLRQCLRVFASMITASLALC